MKSIVDGIATEYSDEGSGTVILMLHGWGNSLHSFDALAELLVSGYRIIRLDVPGFGGSEMPPNAWGVGEYAEFVRTFIENNSLEVDALIGHSLGGRIILKGLANKTIQARKTVLIASAGVADRNTVRNWGFKIVAKTGKMITKIPPFSLVRTKLRRTFYDAAGSDYLHAGPMTPTFLKVINENLATIAPLISTPTLLIWGRDDEVTPLSEGERLHALIPQSNLEIIEGTGHFVHQEKADAVAALVEEFLV